MAAFCLAKWHQHKEFRPRNLPPGPPPWLPLKFFMRVFFMCFFRSLHLVAPYCAIPRDYLSDTPVLRAMGFLLSQHGQLGAIPPPPFLSVPLGEHAKWRCDTPPSEGVSQRYVRYTLLKTAWRQMSAIPPSAILSRKGIARYGGVSRTGPLSPYISITLHKLFSDASMHSAILLSGPGLHYINCFLN